MFILHFIGGKTHLTLEIDEKNNLYGLPLKLTKNAPHLVDLLLEDILLPVLTEIRLRHPEVERQPGPAEIVTLLPEKPPVEEGPVQPTKEIRPVERGRRPPKPPPRILTPIVRVLFEPEPPKPTEGVRRSKVVFHSRNRILEHLGKKIPDSVVDQIMRDIKEFEFGRGNFKALVYPNGMYNLKSGRFRIILEDRGGSFYSIFAVGARKEIFRSQSKFIAW